MCAVEIPKTPIGDHFTVKCETNSAVDAVEGNANPCRALNVLCERLVFCYNKKTRNKAKDGTLLTATRLVINSLSCWLAKT